MDIKHEQIQPAITALTREKVNKLPERALEHIIRAFMRRMEVPDLTEAHTVEWVYV